MMISNKVYMPGIPTYGIDGSKGANGENGGVLFYTDIMFDDDSNKSALQEFVTKLKKSYIVKDTLNEPIARAYQIGDLFLTSDGNIYELTNTSLNDLEVGYTYNDFLRLRGNIAVDSSNTSLNVVNGQIYNTENYGISIINNKSLLSEITTSNYSLSIADLDDDSRINHIVALSTKYSSDDDAYINLNYDNNLDSFVFLTDKPLLINSEQCNIINTNEEDTFDNYTEISTEANISRFLNQCKTITYVVDGNNLYINNPKYYEEFSTYSDLLCKVIYVNTDGEAKTKVFSKVNFNGIENIIGADVPAVISVSLTHYIETFITESATIVTIIPEDEEESITVETDAEALATKNVLACETYLEIAEETYETATETLKSKKYELANGLITEEEYAEAESAVTEATASVVAASENLTTAQETLSNVKANAILVTSIINNQNSRIYLTTGNSSTLSVTVYPEDATNKTLLWESSDESAITVDQTGKITAITATEETVIAATATDGSDVSTQFWIVSKNFVAPHEMIFSEVQDEDGNYDESLEPLVLNHLDSTCVFVYYPEAEDSAIDTRTTFITSDSSIISVMEMSKECVQIDEAGAYCMVCGENSGDAILYAISDANPDVSTELKIHVPDVQSTSLEFFNFADIYNCDYTYTVNALIKPTEVTHNELIWTSSDPTVIEIIDYNSDLHGSSGAINYSTCRIKTNSAGSATITATTTDGSNISISKDVTVGEFAFYVYTDGYYKSLNTQYGGKFYSFWLRDGYEISLNLEDAYAKYGNSIWPLEYNKGTATLPDVEWLSFYTSYNVWELQDNFYLYAKANKIEGIATTDETEEIIAEETIYNYEDYEHFANS